MTSSWQSESGHLALHWSEFAQSDQYHPRWLLEGSEAERGYVPPLPDFANHSPFGGVSWFQPDPAGRNETIFR